ncbi:MAG: shikimate dehydrogenase [Gammaproteobacteria bacterium]|nr:shikimate dehydrogenase [Gammaproteobacteria bacterium]MCW8839741.1 shikimate dehydrogenase [Gammaproteobacteria bacterium]MCW8928040.1 shikimate dehydrogenase [Gammaproteobacteria bacterium]MCW8957966.1 shikimate dehydrogenase [Gammaproteobacteria bacterium]MCW8973964.1 shikimate dehydrogenase [Gammaproteobacteria bacterium]
MAKLEQYAVMGNPIAHSKSPQIHALFAAQTGQKLEYRAILVEIGQFNEAVREFQEQGGKGLNVTVPFKRDAWRLVDERSECAELAGAVNTIVLRPDGTLYGDNTDGVGMVRDIKDNQGVAIEGKKVLILGAGGAVRGVLGPVLNQKPAEVVIANRTPDRAQELADAFEEQGRVDGCGFDDLDGSRYDIVINGTSASLKGEVPPLPEGILARGAFCYDMMYGGEPTAFMRWAEEEGCEQVSDGLGMLVEQAAESFAIWRGVRPETAPVIRAVREQISG